MPIPPGSHQVPGQPNRVQLEDGSVVTRASALSMGARFMGYKSHNDYRKNAVGDKKYFDAWKRTDQGQAAIAREREIARAEGRRFNQSQVAQRLIAARNARPHPRGQAPGGRQAFVDFMTRYDFTGHPDWVAY